MGKNRAIGAVVVVLLGGLGEDAAAQTTVPYTSTGWLDFGSTATVGVAGNFLPGWTTLTGSPDLGQNLFSIPTQSLSGPASDGALWMLHFDPTHGGFGGNEATRLSLSGFTAGTQYRLDFFATLVLSTFASWNATLEDLEVDIAGADVSTFSTTLLADAGNHDGVNAWTPQSIVFTAMGPVVEFRFNQSPVSADPGLVGRIGIDGMSAAVVPGPGAVGVLAAAGIAAAGGRRRRARR